MVRKEMELHVDSTVSRILVRFSDGGSFEINAKSASEYVLDSSFVRFLFICILLYAILLRREDVVQLAPYSQLMLWISVFFVTAAWIVISTSVNMYLIRRGIISFIFTPAIIFPMVPINILAASFVSQYLGAEYWITFPDNIAPIAKNIVAAVCFDILHGRYVAPSHPTYVRKDEPAAPVAKVADVPAQQIQPTQSQSIPAEQDDQETELPQPAPVDEAAPEVFVTISQQRLDVRQLVYLKSEDHYLKIQKSDTSLLLRGKLKEAVKQLDHRLGIQINRSVWIAFSAIISVAENSSGYLEVTLNDDTSFKIANSRKMLFLQHYNPHKIANSG